MRNIVSLYDFLRDIMANKLVEMVRTQCARKGDKEVYRQKDNVTNEWKVTTWNEFRSGIEKVAHALQTLGIGCKRACWRSYAPKSRHGTHRRIQASDGR